MLDPAIKEFFDQRKEAWLKKNSSANASPEDVVAKALECDEAFALGQWLPSAAKRAGQISISTHPCTFSHPSARKNKNGYVTSIIADAQYQADGYLRTGNVSVAADALGNAAALDVYKFLNIQLQDGLTLLQHITEDTDVAKHVLNIPTASYVELKDGFLAMVQSSGDDTITSSKIKQVYFPVGDDYHQLSLLTNSGLLFELRRRLDSMRFSPEVKALRELKKNQQYSAQGYSEIYDLTTIGYGGTKPQNISVLNNQNGGKAHLLSSVPPTLSVREIRFPTANFFTESLIQWSYKDLFKNLHKIMTIELGGNIPRQTILTARDNCIKELIFKIMDTVHGLRQASAEQYSEASALPMVQVIWLCEHKLDERENTDEWLDAIIHEMVRWLINHYSKALSDKRILLGDEEFSALKQIINDLAIQHKELLR